MIGIETPDETDYELLKSILTKHQKVTDSPLASSILKDWANEKSAFIKIMPYELKRVLEAKAELNKTA